VSDLARDLRTFGAAKAFIFLLGGHSRQHRVVFRNWKGHSSTQQGSTIQAEIDGLVKAIEDSCDILRSCCSLAARDGGYRLCCDASARAFKLVDDKGSDGRSDQAAGRRVVNTQIQLAASHGGRLSISVDIVFQNRM
jgi:hypothetical protein